MNARETSAMCAAMLFILATGACTEGRTSTPDVHRTALAEDTFLFSAAEGNLVIFNGPASVVIAGVQSPALAGAAVREMGPRRNRPVYLIAMASDRAVSYGDGGWGARGAVTMAHELLRGRMVKQLADTATASAAVPVVGFSEVIQIYLPGVAVHAVHQDPGYSDNDVSVHFHSSKVLMLGNIFTADGYPAIDTTQGGTFTGLLETAAWFAETFGEEAVIVPARGPALRGRDLHEYAAMLQMVHDRVEPLVRRGRALAEVIAADPLADLNARWGGGPVGSTEFLTTVYRALQAR